MLLNALCSSWDKMIEQQQLNFAASLFGCIRSSQGDRIDTLSPLLHRIWLWRFTLDPPIRVREHVGWELRQKISMRSQAEKLLLPKKRKKRQTAEFLLECWANQASDFRLELLCTSDFLLNRLQYKPEQLQQLLLNGTGKLNSLRQLATEFQVPLHFLKPHKAKQLCRPLFHWSKELQIGFANFWCLPLIADQRLETLKWPLSEQLIVRCAQLLLALPAVERTSPVDGLMDFCAATQLPPGEGEINDVPAEVSAQNALLRGSCGYILDQLVLLLAASDQPTSILPIFEKQLGRGVSKQAARSFPRLLRRLAPADARRALAKMLTADPSRPSAVKDLKVAEQVALVRLMGEFLGQEAVELLKIIWQKCHRDVAGAVLCQFCHSRVVCEASVQVIEDVCVKVKAGEMEPYQLQILLKHLHENPCDEGVARVLATLGHDAEPALATLSLGALACWAKQIPGNSPAVAADVSAMAGQVLCNFGAEWQAAVWPATCCLMELSKVDPDLLKNGLQPLATAEGMAALVRLRLVAEQLAEAKPALRVVASSLLLGIDSGASFRWGLELWALDLPWNEAGQLHLALQRLPMLAAEPFCLAVLLRCFQESLRRSRCSENELQDAAQHLTAECRTAGPWREGLLVMLLAMANHKTCREGLRFLEEALRFTGTPSVALQVLLADIPTEKSTSTTAPQVPHDSLSEEFDDDEEDFA